MSPTNKTLINFISNCNVCKFLAHEKKWNTNSSVPNLFLNRPRVISFQQIIRESLLKKKGRKTCKPELMLKRILVARALTSGPLILHQSAISTLPSSCGRSDGITPLPYCCCPLHIHKHTTENDPFDSIRKETSTHLNSSCLWREDPPALIRDRCLVVRFN